MFLRATRRKKDGKEHRYWSVVENRRLNGDRVVQKVLLYLGEINDAQRTAWTRTIEAVEGKERVQLALFPSDRQPLAEVNAVRLRMNELSLLRPRQWGACWLTMELWERLRLDEFWRPLLPDSREGTSWLNVLKTLVAYRLIDPGSEWRLHRLWFERSAMADLLGEDFGLAAKDNLYRCLDKVAAHKEQLFTHLRERWTDMFGAKFEVLLYDLTSTYFESDPPEDSTSKKKYGHSRDKRPDCVQVIVALIVTPDGFPLAYEVMEGNRAEKTTLKGFLEKIEGQYGKADRIWVMDRGIPTEEMLDAMRNSSSPVYYLVGTPKGRLNRMEDSFVGKPWRNVRDKLRVKLAEESGEVYVLAESVDRVCKERAMRRRRLKKLWRRLHELKTMKQDRDELLMRLGAAKKEAGRAWSLVDIVKNPFTFKLNRTRIRDVRRREGRYLLRTNLVGHEPESLWRMYIQLTEVEQAFKELKNDLNLRPIHHQKDNRIEAHIFVSFLAYCLSVTLKKRLRRHAQGLTPREVLDQMRGMQMIDVRVPTTDGRWLTMSRYTQPDKAQALLLVELGLSLPAQPPPKITAEMIPGEANAAM